MRMLFAVVALLVVVAVVMKLSATQVQSLQPAGVPGTPSPKPAAQAAADQIGRAIEQGAAARAADAASQ